MINYADTEFYTNTYLCGKSVVLQQAADYYFREATQLIKAYTGSNFDESDIPENVRMCCCELAEKLYHGEQVDSDIENVSSESVGGWSKSFESSHSRKQRLDKELRCTVYKWLSGSGLLYRGIK